VAPRSATALLRRSTTALTALLLLAATALSSNPASADTPTDRARHRALQLADQVSALETKVEVAGEAYAVREQALGDVVEQQVQAQHELDQLDLTRQDDRAALAQQVRALYMSAGDMTLLPTLLRGDSPQDVFTQLDTVDRVLRHQQKVAGSVQARVAAVQVTTLRLERLADQRTALADQADAAQAAVVDLLQKRSDALSSASAEVLRLEQQDIAAAQAASEARAAAALTAAQIAVSADLPNPLPPASPEAAQAIAAARAEIGKPYLYGGNGPDAFDCSGLTKWAYAAAGVTLPRTSREQWNVGPHVALADLQPGDLLFWATDVTNPATIHHVALYVGAGWMIEAPHTGDVVHFSRMYLDGYIGATRPPGV